MLSTFTVTNSADSGSGSLRQAIIGSNAATGTIANTITFDIGGGGVQTIAPSSPLPAITHAVVVDGTTQPGGGSAPRIVLDGGILRGATAVGLDLKGSNITLKGLTIDAFAAEGLLLDGASGALISGDYIGLTSLNNVTRGNGDGVLLQNGAHGNVFAGNVIAGNARDGVSLSGAGTTNNLIAGNDIGTDTTGSIPLGNQHGVSILSGASNNTVGGTTVAARNIISGNVYDGVMINGDSGAVTGNVVEGNYIGTDASGSHALGNGTAGVYLWSSASNNTIGGTTTAARNVISANLQAGVIMYDAGCAGNTVEGNYIGTDVSGSHALGNSSYGVEIGGGAINNTVGGTTAGARNIISANGTDGVFIGGGAGAVTGNVVEGNYIGTDTSGAVALGNDFAGVYVWDGASNNIIGGTVAGARNVIAANGLDGVFIGTDGGVNTGNVVEGNYIGTDASGSHALGNSFGVQIGGGTSNSTVGGTTAGAGNVISANSQYGVYLGDGLGVVSGTVVEGNYIGTDASGSHALGNACGVAIVGKSSGNTLGGTTAAARNVIAASSSDGVLLYAGAGAVTDNVVEGNYIGTDASGAHALGNYVGLVILDCPTSNTVGGTTAGARNIISGNTTQGIDISGAGTTGNVVEGNYIGTDVTGSHALANVVGVWIQSGATGNTIGGTAAGARNVISANTADGVQIDYVGTSGNVVEGDYIGTDASGGVALGNGRAGVYLWSGVSGNIIGGTNAAARNVIAASGQYGVIIDAGSTGNTVEGNYIGTDASGSHALGNAVGVTIQGGASDNTIGGTAAGARNIISANRIEGVYITGQGTDYNVVEGNDIGTDSTGLANLGNTGDGLDIVNGASFSVIGGSTTSASNLITFNTGNGLFIFGSTTYGSIIETDTINANGGVGVYDYLASAASIVGCIIKSNQGWGILIYGTSTTYYAYDTILMNGDGSILLS